jgi:NAD-dependent SIR2 family protein deacetylase
MDYEELKIKEEYENAYIGCIKCHNFVPREDARIKNHRYYCKECYEKDLSTWEQIQAAKKRKIIKRQLRKAGIKISASIKYDLAALRKLRREVL